MIVECSPTVEQATGVDFSVDGHGSAVPAIVDRDISA